MATTTPINLSHPALGPSPSPENIHSQVAEENKVACSSNYPTERDSNPELEAAWRALEESEEYGEMMRYGRNPGMLRAMFWKAFRKGFTEGQKHPVEGAHG